MGWRGGTVTVAPRRSEGSKCGSWNTLTRPWLRPPGRSRGPQSRPPPPPRSRAAFQGPWGKGFRRCLQGNGTRGRTRRHCKQNRCRKAVARAPKPRAPMVIAFGLRRGLVLRRILLRNAVNLLYRRGDCDVSCARASAWLGARLGESSHGMRSRPLKLQTGKR